MSTLFTEIVRVGDITPHPNADRLEVAKIKGTTVVVGKGTFAAGDTAIYFPPGMLIPEDIAESMGVKKFLKHAERNGIRSQCRVAACRLRGQPSYGFLMPLTQLPIGSDVSGAFDATKYEPPVRQNAGDAETDHPHFHQYTNIEHYWRYPDAIPVGTPVRITEKLHGTNSRVGLLNGIELAAGSHRVRRKQPDDFSKSLYWSPFADIGVKVLLGYLSTEDDHTVILFGEIYGEGVQDMDYGVKRGYRVFDISVNGQYLDWDAVIDACHRFDVPAVPLLYYGPFSPELVEKFTNGPTTMPGEIKSAFKGREGIVITPLTEQHSDILGGRLILKSVSADYLDRKGAQDHE